MLCARSVCEYNYPNTCWWTSSWSTCCAGGSCRCSLPSSSIHVFQIHLRMWCGAAKKRDVYNEVWWSVLWMLLGLFLFCFVTGFLRSALWCRRHLTTSCFCCCWCCHAAASEFTWWRQSYALSREPHTLTSLTLAPGNVYLCVCMSAADWNCAEEEDEWMPYRDCRVNKSKFQMEWVWL